jgi:signal transduction histidine kinase
VRDHGPGIPEGFRHRIFNKFVQVDRKDARAKVGTGLGLTIVKQIVDHLKGDVGYEPAPGGGSIFYVTLPSIDTFLPPPDSKPCAYT